MSVNNAKLKFDHIRADLPRFGWKIIYDWSFSLSALIAYNLLISILPLILCLFAIASLIFANSPDVLNSIRVRLVNAFPGNSLSDAADALLKSLSQQAGIIFLITFSVSVFAGSRLLIAIDDVLTIIYRMRERTILEQNIHAIKMLLAFIILMPVIILTSLAPAVFTQTETFYRFGTTLSSGIFGFILFALIYYYVPKRQMYWHHIWCGALFGAIGLQILLFLFPIYVHLFMSNYIGQLGLIIITVLFFYIVGLLFVMGAQINSYFFDHIESPTAGLGNRLCESFDQENMKLIDVNSQSNNSTPTLTAGFNPIP